MSQTQCETCFGVFPTNELEVSLENVMEKVCNECNKQNVVGFVCGCVNDGSYCKDRLCDDLICLDCNPSGFCKDCVPFVYELLKDFDEEGGELYFKYFESKTMDCGLMISVDGDIWYRTEYSGSSYFSLSCCNLFEIEEDEEDDYEPEYYTTFMDKETMIDFLDWTGEDSRV